MPVFERVFKIENSFQHIESDLHHGDHAGKDANAIGTTDTVDEGPGFSLYQNWKQEKKVNLHQIKDQDG